MKHDWLDLALQEVSQTKILLASLITSSESFDYPTAKNALRHLEKKVKTLTRLQARLKKIQSSRTTGVNVEIVDFTGNNSRPKRPQAEK